MDAHLHAIETKLNRLQASVDRIETVLGCIARHEAWVHNLRRRLDAFRIVDDQGEDGDLLSFLGNMVVRAAARRERGVNFTNSPRRLPLHTR